MSSAHPRLTLRMRPPARGGVQPRIDATALSPDRLAGLPDDILARVHLHQGARTVELHELFDIERQTAIGPDGPAAQDAELVLTGPRAALARLDRVGTGMQSGRLTVDGDTGHYAGHDMRGGTLHVRGSAGDHLACGLRGGLVRIERNAGEAVGGVLPGSDYGMRGGTVLVHGSVGRRCGDRMRRGLLLVEGDAGELCAHRLVAGTIIVGGRVGAHGGVNLLHGTLIVRQRPPQLPATYGDSGLHALAILKLMQPVVASHSPALGRALRRSARVRRLCGDLALGGRGEILILSKSPPQADGPGTTTEQAR